MKNIILIGMKACGKSTVGKLLAEKLRLKFIELDQEIEKAHLIDKKEKLTFREIFKKHGADYFRTLEKKVLKTIAKKNNKKPVVLACGGGTPLDPENQLLLRRLGKIIFLDAREDVLLPRILKHGVPAFFPFQNDPEKSLDELLKKRKPVYKITADKTISFNKKTPEEIANKIISLLK